MSESTPTPTPSSEAAAGDAGGTSGASTPPPSPKGGRKKKDAANPPPTPPGQLDAFPPGTACLSAATGEGGDAMASPKVPQTWLHDLGVQTVREARNQLPSAFQVLLTALRDPAGVPAHQVAAASAMLQGARLDLLSEEDVSRTANPMVAAVFAVAGGEEG